MTAATPSAVLFDLDGTLIDTAPDLVGALDDLLREHGRSPLPYARSRGYASHGSNGLVRLGFPEADAGPFEPLRQRFLDVYAARIARESRLFAGCETLLDTLEAHQRPWGIVTNKPAFLTAPLLGALGLAGRAGCVVSGDTLPERKPHPAPLLHAASLIGVDPAQCLYVGDAERDIQSARAAGMPVLVARYGYLSPEDDPEAWAADGSIDDPRAVLRWLGL
jgi:phosphoglycolate phosphatase